MPLTDLDAVTRRLVLQTAIEVTPSWVGLIRLTVATLRQRLVASMGEAQATAIGPTAMAALLAEVEAALNSVEQDTDGRRLH